MTAQCRNARQFTTLVDAACGDAELFDLPSAGLRGTTHISFADLNNVADQFSQFLKNNALDR